MRQPLKYLEQSIEYKFNNIDLLKHAVTHRSYGEKHNERLEFLGDALLGLIIAEKLYYTFPKLDEGDLTRSRSSLVKGETLYKLAQEFKINSYILLGDGELKSGGLQRKSIMADCVEAIISAVYKDSDFEKCKQVVLNWYEEYFNDDTFLKFRKDSKSILQEWLQARKYKLPDYDLVSDEGDAHDKTFVINCIISEPNINTRGVAKSRREAEQIAASKAMQEIEEKKNG